MLKIHVNYIYEDIVLINFYLYMNFLDKVDLFALTEANLWSKETYKCIFL